MKHGLKNQRTPSTIAILRVPKDTPNAAEVALLFQQKRKLQNKEKKAYKYIAALEQLKRARFVQIIVKVRKP
jgi:hypothetical protein